MLRIQLLYFLPLAAAVVMLAFSVGRELLLYAATALGALAVAAVLLYLIMLVFTPEDGLLHLPTLLAAYVMPVLLIAGALRLFGKQWSRESNALAGFGGAVVASAFAPLLLLVAACSVQGNCL